MSPTFPIAASAYIFRIIKETDLIFLQIYNKEKIEKIKKIIEQYKYEIKSEEQYIKIVIEIEEMKDGL